MRNNKEFERKLKEACDRLAEERIKEVNALSDEDIKIPESLDERVFAIINGEELPKRTRSISPLRVAMAVIILAAVVLASCAIFVHYGEIVFEKEDREEHFSLKTNTPYEGEIIFDKQYPTYIPDDFEVLKEKLTDSMFKILYVNKENIIITYNQAKINFAEQKIDGEKEKAQEVLIGEHKGLVLYREEENRNVVYWESGSFEYAISSEISVEELLKMAESVR